MEASPGVIAVCPTCLSTVLPKCGSFRIHHWAHKGNRECDSWAEKETPWHRAWKNKFPTTMQEFIHTDSTTGEKHIADVRTEHGLILEFQHSHIEPAEQMAREQFYGNMIWVVDGTRLKYDYPRLLKGKSSLHFMHHVGEIGYFRCSFPDEIFPAKWLNSSVPVIFDFKGSDEPPSNDESREDLWCLSPTKP